MERKGTRGPTANVEETVTTVDIEEIERDTDVQVRHSESQPQIRRYATAYKGGAPFPPVTLAELDGKLFIVDGFHRVEAQRRNKAPFIEAKIVKATSMEEIRAMAGEANLTNGLPLKANVLHEVFRRYVKAGRHKTAGGRIKSARDMAADLKDIKAHVTIMTWMWKDFPRIAKEAHWKKPAGIGREKGNDTVQYRLMHTVEKSLENAVTAFSGVKGKKERGLIIHQTERTLQQMKDGGDWKPYEPEETGF